MHRRTFLSGAAAATAVGVAGCLGGENGDAPTTDDGHIEALQAELDDRGVVTHEITLSDRVVEVDHGYEEDPNDAIAEVAMAFVERIIDDWDVERLEGHLRDEGNDWAWHAEAAWAREYADEEIGPEEYGQRISETMAMVLDEDEDGDVPEDDTPEEDEQDGDDGEDEPADEDGPADEDDETADDE